MLPLKQNLILQFISWKKLRHFPYIQQGNWRIQRGVNIVAGFIFKPKKVHLNSHRQKHSLTI